MPKTVNLPIEAELPPAALPEPAAPVIEVPPPPGPGSWLWDPQTCSYTRVTAPTAAAQIQEN